MNRTSPTIGAAALPVRVFAGPEALARWLALAALLALPACAERGGPDLSPVVRDSAGVLIHEFPGGVLDVPATLRLPGDPGVRIGVVEGAPEYQWTRPVAAARLAGGGFAVLEQTPAEVRVFDASGRFLRRVGAQGDGPGEFRRPVGLAALPGDTLVVWDRGPRRLTWFTRSGVVGRELTLRDPGGIRTLRRVELSPSGAVVALGATTTPEELANRGRVREIWHLVPILPGGGAGAPLGTVAGTERAIEVEGGAAGEILAVRVQGRWWWGEGFAWAGRRGVWTADALAFEARHFDLRQGLDRIVRVAAPDRPFSPALIDSLHAVELARVDDPELRDQWRADFAGREYPGAVPPLAAVFADEAGRVWLGLTDPPPEGLPSGELPAVRRWVVFAPNAPAAGSDEGTLGFLSTVTLPPRSHPLWADGEGVLLVRNDPEFDVAYVEWYPFDGAGAG